MRLKRHELPSIRLKEEGLGVKIMSIKKEPNNEKQKGQFQQNVGSNDHRDHASHIPDYGGNTVDPNAYGLSNRKENTDH